MSAGNIVCGIRLHFFTDVFPDHAGEGKRAGTGRMENVSVRAFGVYGSFAGGVSDREQCYDRDVGNYRGQYRESGERHCAV